MAIRPKPIPSLNFVLFQLIRTLHHCSLRNQSYSPKIAYGAYLKASGVMLLFTFLIKRIWQKCSSNGYQMPFHLSVYFAIFVASQMAKIQESWKKWKKHIHTHAVRQREGAKERKYHANVCQNELNCEETFQSRYATSLITSHVNPNIWQTGSKNGIYNK